MADFEERGGGIEQTDAQADGMIETQTQTRLQTDVEHTGKYTQARRGTHLRELE